jgi:hypothetical protein
VFLAPHLKCSLLLTWSIPYTLLSHHWSVAYSSTEVFLLLHLKYSYSFTLSIFTSLLKYSLLLSSHKVFLTPHLTEVFLSPHLKFSLLLTWKVFFPQLKCSLRYRYSSPEVFLTPHPKYSLLLTWSVPWDVVSFRILVHSREIRTASKNIFNWINGRTYIRKKLGKKLRRRVKLNFCKQLYA